MKLSKLALLPLLALVLGSCGTQKPAPSTSEGEPSSQTTTVVPSETTPAGSETTPAATETETGPVETTTTPVDTGTETEPVVPVAWTEEQINLMKGALGGNVLPFFYYEGGELSVETLTEGDLSMDVVKYTLLNAPETVQDELVALFSEDGYIPNPDATTATRVVMNKIFTIYLNEQIAMSLTTGVTPKGEPFLTGEWFYMVSEANPNWADARYQIGEQAFSIDEITEAFGCIGKLPAPTFDVEHVEILAVNGPKKFVTIALFEGNHAADYIADLALAGYTIDGGEIAPGQPGFFAINDIFKVQVVIFYEPEIDGVIIQAAWTPTTEWYTGYVSAMIKKATGLEKVYLPEPTTVPVDDYTVFPYFVDEEKTKQAIAIEMVSDNAKAAVAYVSDLIEDGNFLAKAPTKEAPEYVVVDPLTLAEIVVTPYNPETGTFLVKVAGTLAAGDPETIKSVVGPLNAFTAETFGTYLPEMPEGALAVDVLFLEEADYMEIFATTLAYAHIYADPLAAATALATSLKGEGSAWVVLDEELEDLGTFRAKDTESGLIITVEVNERLHAVITTVQSAFEIDAYDWETLLPEEAYGWLRNKLAWHLDDAIPFIEKATDTSLVACEVAAEGIVIQYVGASFDPVTQADFDAWLESLVAAGWVYNETEGVYILEDTDVSLSLEAQYIEGLGFAISITDITPAPEFPAELIGQTYEGEFKGKVTTVVITDENTITVDGVAATDIKLSKNKLGLDILFSVDGVEYIMYSQGDGAAISFGTVAAAGEDSATLMKKVAEEGTPDPTPAA